MKADNSTEVATTLIIQLWSLIYKYQRPKSTSVNGKKTQKFSIVKSKPCSEPFPFFTPTNTDRHTTSYTCTCSNVYSTAVPMNSPISGKEYC